MRHDVLCQCGWGLLAVPEDEIPEFCPVCGYNFLAGDPWEDYGSHFEDGDDTSDATLLLSELDVY